MRYKILIFFTIISFTFASLARANDIFIDSKTEDANASDDEDGFYWSVEVDAVSTYLWRGFNIGGLSLQPYAEVGYGGAYVGAWYNCGAANWAFEDYNGEINLSVGFSRWGLNAYFLLLHTFDDTPLFQFKNSVENVNEGQGSTMEFCLEYTVSEKVPLSFAWNTCLWGTDGYSKSGVDEITDKSDIKRAYSTFVEVGYLFNLPDEHKLQTKVGFTPWKSVYTDYEGNFAFNCLSVQWERTWEIGEHIALKPFMLGMLNTYDLNKHNFRREVGAVDDQKLNLCVGLNVSFF